MLLCLILFVPVLIAALAVVAYVSDRQAKKECDALFAEIERLRRDS